MTDRIELRFELPPGKTREFLALSLPGDGDATQQLLRTTYFDSPNLGLAADGIALRQRWNGQRLLQSVIVRDRGLQFDAAIGTDPEAGADSFDFSRIDEPRSRQLLECHKNTLVPIFCILVRRTCWQLQPIPDATVDLELDSGTVESGARTARLCELRLRLRNGDPGALFALASTLQQALPLRLLAISKAEQGLSLFLGQPSPPLKARFPALSTHAAPADAFRLIALSCLKHLQANHAGVAKASENPEYIHQMRVAIRRLRSALRTFAPHLPPGFLERWDPPWRALGHTLGNARNWDVFGGQTLPALASTFPGHRECRRLVASSERRRAACRRAARAVVTGPAYSNLLSDFQRALFSPLTPVRKPSRQTDGRPVSLTDIAVRCLARMTRRIEQQAVHVTALDAVERHQMRITFKKLRYPVEFFAPLLPFHRVKAYQQALEYIQDALGELNDLAVAQELVAMIPGVKPDGLMAGWLAGRNHLLVAQFPDKLARFLDARKPWRGIARSAPRKATHETHQDQPQHEPPALAPR